MFEKEQNVSLEITNTKTKTKIKNKQKQTNEQTNKIKERNDVKESHLASNLISIDKLVQNVCVCVCVFCLFFFWILNIKLLSVSLFQNIFVEISHKMAHPTVPTNFCQSRQNMKISDLQLYTIFPLIHLTCTGNTKGATVIEKKYCRAICMSTPPSTRYVFTILYT